ncbi:hypothetical protein BT63DRAFT_77426 [Microthyrium microscopicum]|uniref:2EXR domain-containing protein n=1 Tax=Microthyrium microscopicum TaxID=703497 RepID=A0A6A6U4G7_9PEZI|nr:hypothetical protein BT63DRAFT_77426 [Microthyrium microscopicum]
MQERPASMQEGWGMRRQSSARRPRANPSSINNMAMSRPFPFMQLPTEIRQMVYSMALKTHSTLSFGCKHVLEEMSNETKTIGNYIALLRTSRHIHLEASQVLYSRNFFRAHRECHAGCIAHHPYRHLIEQVCIVQLLEPHSTFDMGDDEAIRFSGVEVLKNLPGLRKIDLCFIMWELTILDPPLRHTPPIAWGTSLEFVVGPYIQQIKRYQRKYPKIKIDKPELWREFINDYNLKGNGRERTGIVHFYMIDKTPSMANLVKICIDFSRLPKFNGENEIPQDCYYLE